jgi:hypothetical protein
MYSSLHSGLCPTAATTTHNLMCDRLSILFFLINFDSCVNTIQTVCKNVAQLPNSKRIAKLHSPAFDHKVATLEMRIYSFVHSKRAPNLHLCTVANRSMCATPMCHTLIHFYPGTPLGYVHFKKQGIQNPPFRKHTGMHSIIMRYQKPPETLASQLSNQALRCTGTSTNGSKGITARR